MKLKRRSTPHQLLSAGASLLLLAVSAAAQDRIVTRDGRTQTVQIIGVSGGNLQVKIGAGSMALPLATVTQVVMTPPADYAEAVKAYEAKNYPKALVNAKSVADKYRGLPTDWARQASAMVGDIYSAMNDAAKAEAAYKDYQKAYPGAGSEQSALGIAKVALMKKDYAGARAKLQSLADAALKEANPSPAAAPVYSQAFYILGQVDEAEGMYPAALENYLRTVTIFPEDRLAADGAQEKADALRKAHPGIVVP